MTEAHLSHNEIVVGTSMMIVGLMVDRDPVVIFLADNSRIQGTFEVVDHTTHILADNKEFALRLWEPEDDPLPTFDGHATKWTVESVA